MGTFPTAIPSYLGFTATHSLAADTHAAQHNQEQADIIALANKVGTGASTPSSGLVLAASGTGTSSWSQVNLTTMVSGVLPVANGGTGATSTTGTGSVVFGTSPTITNPTESGGTYNTATLNSPTISNFTNAQHNHQNAAGGGTLNGASALQAATVDASRINFGGSGAGIWWQEIGRTTLAVAGNTISVPSLTAMTYLKVIVNAISNGVGTGVSLQIRFNNDSGNNYSYRSSTNGAADSAVASASSIILAGTGTNNWITVADIVNLASSEKNIIGLRAGNFSGTGAGTAPDKADFVGKWANTAVQITQIDILNLLGTGNFAINSEVIVLGHN